MEIPDTEQSSRLDESQSEHVAPAETAVQTDETSGHDVTLTDHNQTGVSEVSEQGFQTAEETLSDANVSNSQGAEETAQLPEASQAVTDNTSQADEASSSTGRRSTSTRVQGTHCVQI